VAFSITSRQFLDFFPTGVKTAITASSNGMLVLVAMCGQIDKVCGSGTRSVFFFVGDCLHK
jgi:hypothetical protein